jgi:predicted DNA-binding transcriptional regulator AlpA
MTTMTPTADDPDRLIDEREAAGFLCYSVRALQNWRVRGGGPRFVKVSGRSVRYRRRDILAWIEERTRSNTSEAA